MSTITASLDAITALLAINAGTPTIPDDLSETWLTEHGLIGYSTDGAVLEIKDKGRAFIAMLEATPLPVKVERWDDPRAVPAPPPPPAAPAIDATALLAGLAAILTKGAAPAAIAAPAPQPAPQPASGPVVIPPDYTAVKEEWTRLPLGQWPVELAADNEILTLWRNGQVRKVAAVQSVRWLHMNKPDDVIAYKLLATDTIVRMG